MPTADEHAQRLFHVILNNDTRWLSQLFIIRRALQIRTYLELTLLEFKQKWEAEDRARRDAGVRASAARNILSCLRLENELNTTNWNVLKKFERILTLYEATVVALEGDGQVRARHRGFAGSYGNIWKVLQNFEFLLGELELYKLAAPNLPALEHFRAALNLAWTKLDKYYKKVDKTFIYYTSIALHPAYKGGWFHSQWAYNPD
jgi:hypothetical protein